MEEKDPVLTKLFNNIYGRKTINRDSLVKLLNSVDIECIFLLAYEDPYLQIINNKFTLYSPSLNNSDRLYYFLRGYLIKKYLNISQIELISLYKFKFTSDVEIQIKKDLFPNLIEFSLEDILRNIPNTIDFLLDDSIKHVWSKIRLTEVSLNRLNQHLYIFNNLIKYYVNPELLFR